MKVAFSVDASGGIGDGGNHLKMRNFRYRINSTVSELRLRRVGKKLSALESDRGGKRLLGNNPRLSFSQFGEDAILQSMLPETVGRYIDVGSGDPIRGSNTYALYLQGWRGYCIDPILSNVVRARSLRPGDVAVHAAVSSNATPVQFYECDPYEYSTASAQRAEELKADGIRCVATYIVNPMKLSDLQCDGSVFTVLSIDVEGMELDVLSTNDWQALRPEILILEDWETPLVHTSELRDYVEEMGYALVGVTGLSCIYRRIEN